MSDFEALRQKLEPKHNMHNISFDCPECETETESAYMSRQDATISWRCTGCRELIVIEEVHI